MNCHECYWYYTCLDCIDIPWSGTACNITTCHLESSNLGRKVLVLGHREIKDGVADAVVDGKGRIGIVGRIDGVTAVGIAKGDLGGNINRGESHVLITPLGAALAGRCDLEVCGVDVRSLLQNLVCGGLVEWRGIVAASPVSVNDEKSGEGMATY